MRKALNDNPLIQAALVGILALAVGLMLLMRMGGSSDSGAETTAADATAPAATDAAATDAAATDAAATDAAAAASTATAPAVPPAAPVDPAAAAPVDPAAAATGDFKAGPGLPKDVVAAYDSGDAVVLLVVNEDSIDDRQLKRIVEGLSSTPDSTLFVTDVKDVADYSRITEGVDLDRTPALVVIRPKKLNDAPLPTAVVSYGFRGSASAKQALENALYKGPSDLPYYPH